MRTPTTNKLVLGALLALCLGLGACTTADDGGTTSTSVVLDTTPPVGDTTSTTAG